MVLMPLSTVYHTNKLLCVIAFINYKLIVLPEMGSCVTPLSICVATCGKNHSTRFQRITQVRQSRNSRDFY